MLRIIVNIFKSCIHSLVEIPDPSFILLGQWRWDCSQIELVVCCSCDR